MVKEKRFLGTGLRIGCRGRVGASCSDRQSGACKQTSGRQPRAAVEDAAPRERLGVDGALEGTFNAAERSRQASDEDNRTDWRFGIRFSVN
jgi:hypothetical protein